MFKNFTVDAVQLTVLVFTDKMKGDLDVISNRCIENYKELEAYFRKEEVRVNTKWNQDNNDEVIISWI